FQDWTIPSRFLETIASSDELTTAARRSASEISAAVATSAALRCGVGEKSSVNATNLPRHRIAAQAEQKGGRGGRAVQSFPPFSPYSGQVAFGSRLTIVSG